LTITEPLNRLLQLQPILHYVRFASAAYGWALLNGIFFQGHTNPNPKPEQYTLISSLTLQPRVLTPSADKDIFTSSGKAGYGKDANAAAAAMHTGIEARDILDDMLDVRGVDANLNSNPNPTWRKMTYWTRIGVAMSLIQVRPCRALTLALTLILTVTLIGGHFLALDRGSKSLILSFRGKYM